MIISTDLGTGLEKSLEITIYLIWKIKWLIWKRDNIVGVLGHFSHVWLFVTLWTIAHQARLFMGFCRLGYWSGLPSPPPADLPDQEIQLESHVYCIGRQYDSNVAENTGIRKRGSWTTCRNKAVIKWGVGGNDSRNTGESEVTGNNAYFNPWNKC